MKIKSYSFGRMVVDGEEYSDDLQISGDVINENWVRERGHRLNPDDLTWVVGKDPDLLIVGTGSSGRMAVTEKTRTYLSEEGIDIWVGKTREAADYFNELTERSEDRKVAGVFHLTC